MTSTFPGAVFDCNIFLQALITEGPAFACVALVEAGQVGLSLCAETLAEAQAVLSRPKLQRQFARLTPERVNEFLSRVQGIAVLVPTVPKVFALPRDPKDEIYVNLALAAGAGFLVTRDKDLLDLMDEGTPEGQAFRQRFPSLRILDPVAFLREFSDRGAEEPEDATEKDQRLDQGCKGDDGSATSG